MSQELREEGHDIGDDPPAANDASAAKIQQPKKEAKANIDATSDEEEDSVEV